MLPGFVREGLSQLLVCLCQGLLTWLLAPVRWLLRRANSLVRSIRSPLATAAARPWWEQAPSTHKGCSSQQLPTIRQRRQCNANGAGAGSMVQAQAPIEVSVCAHCHQQPGKHKCGQCKAVAYCGKDCQLAHWKAGHKTACKQLAHKAQAVSLAINGSSVHCSTASQEEEDELVPVPERVLYPYADFLQFMQPQPHLPLCCVPPVGLRNVGNTCFANALLQCLLHTRPLVAYLRSGEHAEACTRPSASCWCLLCELQALVNQVCAAQEQQVEKGARLVVSPKAITGALRRIASHFVQGKQEDSHDLYVNMLDQVEGVLLHQAGGKAALPDVRTRETTVLGQCFTGYVCFQTVCPSCGWISQRYDTKVELELELSAHTPTLESCLARSFADEQLDDNNRWKCDKCKQQVRATRHSCVEVAPNVLVLCLKRFGVGRFGKINRRVAYRDTLDLAPYRALDAIDNQPATYQLYGVLVHQDHMNMTTSGHYVAYVRTLSNGRWYLCNDSTVHQVSEPEALSQNAYMLFYLRDQPHPAPNPELRQLMGQGTSRPHKKTAPIHAASNGMHASGSNGSCPTSHNSSATSSYGSVDGSCSSSSSLPTSRSSGEGGLGNGHPHAVHAEVSSPAVLEAAGQLANGWPQHHQHHHTGEAGWQVQGLGSSGCLQCNHSPDTEATSSSRNSFQANGHPLVPYVQQWVQGPASQPVEFAGQALAPEQLQLPYPAWSWRPARTSPAADAPPPPGSLSVCVQLPEVSRASEVQVSVWQQQLLVSTPSRLLPLVLPPPPPQPSCAQEPQGSSPADATSSVPRECAAQQQGAGQQHTEAAGQQGESGQVVCGPARAEQQAAAGYAPCGKVCFNTRTHRLRLTLQLTQEKVLFET